ncbi:MAG: hypothetical protein FD159_2092 [Syntrophaceae bacterium]|nr:MAG: hypothetical protein FD159_2092 [Syntrophaceae bacterium]
MPDIRTQYKYVNGALLLLILLAVFAPFALHIPEVNKYLSPINVVPPSCFVKENTGKECATCGLTRSIVAVYNGDFDLSVKFHPLGYLLVCFLFGELLLRAVPIFFHYRWIPWLDMGQLIFVGILFKIAAQNKGL